MTNLKKQRLGTYRLTRLLGEGGFADVFLGEDTIHNEKVAIKVLKTKLTINALRDLINEARASRLNHPNIVQIRDFDVEDDVSYLVMDYASNGSLRDRHPKGTQVPLETVVSYVNQIAPALQYAHNERRMIHRDIKPENMLVAENGDILLSDFGIAAIDLSDAVRIDELVGTVKYMAPEQIQGKPLAASDQYSLAAVIYEWLCGAVPFDGTTFEIITQQIKATPRPLHELLPTISPTVERVIDKALSKDPKDRFGTVQEFADTLERAYQFEKAMGKTGQPADVSRVDRLSALNSSSVGNRSRTPRNVPPPPPARPRKQSSRRKKIHPLLFILIPILLVIILAASWLFWPHPSHPSSSTIHSAVTVIANDGELIGVSDGSDTFDTARSDSDIRHLAAARFSSGDTSGAEALWAQAAAKDRSDAEALIYLEDQRVLDSGRPYITLVVGTVLTGKQAGVGGDVLQGAYVAQKEYNGTCMLPHCTQVRLLIANAGSGDSANNGVAYANYVTEQVATLKRSDPSIVGMVGWPLSSYSLYLQTILAAAHLPLVSPTPLVDILKDIPLYTFSVAPLNENQGSIGAMYAEQSFNPKHLVLFADLVDPYSEKLSESFTKRFTSDGYKIAATEAYTTGDAGSLLPALQDALRHNVDVIYFAGHSNDVGALLSYLPTVCNESNCQNLKILGGDAFYNLAGYPNITGNNFSRLYFTAFAYPDEWSILPHSTSLPTSFFQDYATAFDPHFDPHGHYPGGVYGVNRPDSDVIMSYDATLVLLTACDIAFNAGNAGQKITSSDVQDALTKINGAQAVQGVSGRISFGVDGMVSDKFVLVLHFDQEKRVSYNQSYGCFSKPLPTTTDSNCK